MKCGNFLCNQHDMNYTLTNCAGYVVPGSGNHQFMKNCKARKRYNKIFKDMNRHANNYPEDKFQKERNIYHGRG